jgi:hypothetical protein
MKLSRMRLTAPTIEELFAEAIHLSVALAENLHCGRDTRQFFPALSGVLLSLPLAQGEFAWASCRLTNAVEYVSKDERHAAAWEIGQLSRRLNHFGIYATRLRYSH